MTEKTEKIEELKKVRLDKLKKLVDLGIDPYPIRSLRSHRVAEALADFEKLSSKKSAVTLDGRIRSIRSHGKLTFLDLEDESGQIQVLVRADALQEGTKILELLDVGDFAETAGILILSKTGQKSLDAGILKILSKSLLPLPQEYYGLKDLETKLRQRYLDLLMNPEMREIFKKKAMFWKTIRGFMEQRGFLEVDLSALEPIPGGAEAEPFVTHHNALNRDFYLRISLELPLKKLLVGGFERVFEIGRIFRNEGISTEHLQDYLQLEFYWAFSDYEQLMEMTKQMYQEVVIKVTGSHKTEYDGKSIDWSGDWPKLDYFELFKKYIGIDLNDASVEKLKAYAESEKIKFEPSHGKGRLIDLLFKRKIRSYLIQPCFLINPPIEIEPLAKKDPKNPKQVQRMQIVAAGTELGKGFSELNDPIDQRARFEDQMKLRDAGDKEAQFLDEDYLAAMEYGMPPCSGFGLSERLFAVILNKSVRETVFFPLMKDEGGTGK